MTDSTDTTTAAARFAASMQMAAEARQQQADEAERHRQLMEGELLVRIDELNLSPEQLVAVADFIARGCQVVTDDKLNQQLAEAQQDNVRLQTENDSLRQQVSDLGGDNVIAFRNKGERDRAEKILGYCTNGGGNLIDPNVVRDKLKPKQQAKQKQGASGPPAPADADTDTSQTGTGVRAWLDSKIKGKPLSSDSSTTS